MAHARLLGRTGGTLLLLLFVVGMAHADIPRRLNYQGFLTSEGGEPLHGQADFQFSIYTDSVGGALCWGPEVHTNVELRAGLFELQIGASESLPDSCFDGAQKWLQIEVNGAPLLPRKPIASSAYAFKSGAGGDGDLTDVLAGVGIVVEGPSGPQPVVRLDTLFADSRFVLEGELDAVTGSMVVDNTLGEADLGVDVVSSVDGVTNDGGDIDLVAGANIVIAPDPVAKEITISATGVGGGDVTDVMAGSGIQVSAPEGPQPTVSLSTSYTDALYVNEGQANSIASGMIQSNAVTASQIASGAVGTSEIADNSIAADDIAANAVGSSEIASNAVGSAEIADNSITGSDLAANAVGNTQLQNDITVTTLSASEYQLGGQKIVDEVGGLVRLYALNGDSRFDLTSTSIRAGGSISPTQNRVFNLGASTLRWDTVYAVSADFETLVLELHDPVGEPRYLSTTGGPEPWAEDVGSGRLEGGRTRIELDPLFLGVVTIDQQHPIRVQVQLTGDCAGVYVVKGTTGFDVVELGGGTSDAPFDYRVTAVRRGATGRWQHPSSLEAED